MARIRALPSFRDIALKVQPGETLHTTGPYVECICMRIMSRTN